MWTTHEPEYFEKTPLEKQRVCVNCRHDIRTMNGNICEIDNHRIGYVDCFVGWCKHWANDKKYWKEQSNE